MRSCGRGCKATADRFASQCFGSSAGRAFLRGEYRHHLCRTYGKFSLDDILCAGAIISRILEIGGKQYLDDLARTALTLYDSYKDDLRAPLAGCAHVQRLKALGMEKDIDFCLQEDIMDVVPCYLDGVIRNAL